MINYLLFIWQLPQNFVGVILGLFSCMSQKVKTNDGSVVMVYYLPKLFRSGVSLGNYIILDFIYSRISESRLRTTVSHEYGHSIQSKILGPLYLIIIGLPSLIGNIYSRIMNKDDRWYYNQWQEKWADTLGCVTRF